MRREIDYVYLRMYVPIHSIYKRSFEDTESPKYHTRLTDSKMKKSFRFKTSQHKKRAIRAHDSKEAHQEAVALLRLEKEGKKLYSPKIVSRLVNIPVNDLLYLQRNGSRVNIRPATINESQITRPFLCYLRRGGTIDRQGDQVCSINGLCD